MTSDEMIANVATDAAYNLVGDLFFLVVIPAIILIGLIYALANGKKITAEPYSHETESENLTTDPVYRNTVRTNVFSKN